MINHWVFRCKDITELISQSMDEKLPLHIRLSIKFHLMMCHLCTRYKEQLDLIQKAMGQLDCDGASILPKKKLTNKVKEKMKEMID